MEACGGRKAGNIGRSRGLRAGMVAGGKGKPGWGW